jgi:hypothetical protein
VASDRTPRHRLRIALAVLLLAPAAAALPRLPVAPVRDLEAKDRMFQRGVPVAQGALSPDGFHLAHLHLVRGGWLNRKPRRCAFVLDLGSGETRPIPAPKGTAQRIAGWDPTGRYLLIETMQPDLLSALTGSWTTYHWVYDAVTSAFVPRRPFTGTRDGQRFRWKVKSAYHGAWTGEREAKIWALFEGELARAFEEGERELARQDDRRRALAGRLALGTGGAPGRVLADFLDRLDARWTQRGQRDPVVSDLLGDRPAVYCLRGETWEEVQAETEHVAVLDYGLALLTGAGGAQTVLNVDRGELVELPPPPPGWVEILERRWDRAGGFYDEHDPLPRDLQYRRSWDATQGTAHYFHFVTPDGMRLLILYPFGPERRVLRIVDLPATWGRAGGDAPGAFEEVTPGDGPIAPPPSAG